MGAMSPNIEKTLITSSLYEISRLTMNKSILVVILGIALALIFGLYATPASVVASAGFVRDYICTPADEPTIPDPQVECCAYIEGTLWCTTCDATDPPSNCSPRYPNPTGVAPPPSTEICPENTVIDANGNCAPLTQGPNGLQLDCTTDPSHPTCRLLPPTGLTPPGPKGPLGTIPGGEIAPEVAPPTAPSPEEIAPTVDCAQNPEDPLCETARIPEGEQEEATEEPTTEEEGPSEESGSEEDNGNN